MEAATDRGIDATVENCADIVPPDEPRSPNRIRRVFGRLITITSTLAVAAIVAIAISLTVVPALAGAHTLTVLSGSMVPRLPVGSVVVDRPVDVETLQVGDIVTYETADSSPDPGVLVTHRIIAKDNKGAHSPVFTTKGDANQTADQLPVHASQIRGELWYDVPYIGTVRSFLLAPSGLLMIGSAALLIVAIWFLSRLVRPSRTAGDREKS